MWWKIYFWIYTILTIAGIPATLRYAPFSGGDIIGIAFGFLLILAAYVYVFKKSLFQSFHWKMLFWVVIFIFVEGMLELFVLPKDFIANHAPFLKSNIPLSTGQVLFSWLISLPGVYAIYKLQFIPETASTLPFDIGRKKDDAMFSTLGDLAYKRKPLEAFVFYLVYLLLTLVLAMSTGVAVGMFWASVSGGQQAGNMVLKLSNMTGTFMAFVMCLVLSFGILSRKKLLNNALLIFVAVLSGALALAIGGIVGLIPVAYLTTREPTKDNPLGSYRDGV